MGKICGLAFGMMAQSHTRVCSIAITLGGLASCPFWQTFQKSSNGFMAMLPIRPMGFSAKPDLQSVPWSIRKQG